MKHLVPYNHREVEAQWEGWVPASKKENTGIPYAVISSSYYHPDASLENRKQEKTADVMMHAAAIKGKKVLYPADTRQEQAAFFKAVRDAFLADGTLCYNSRSKYYELDITDGLSFLLAGLDNISMPENYKKMQRNWLLLQQKQKEKGNRCRIGLQAADVEDIWKLEDAGAFTMLLYLYSLHEKEEQMLDCYICKSSEVIKHLTAARFLYGHYRMRLGLAWKEPCRQIFVAGSLRSGEKMADAAMERKKMTEYLLDFGSDCLNMYLIFMGPPEKDGVWSESGLDGIFRYFRRIWNLVHRSVADGFSEETTDSRLIEAALWEELDKIEAWRMNAAIAQLMTYTGKLKEKEENGGITREEIRILLRMLQPFAPCLAAELLHVTGVSRA